MSTQSLLLVDAVLIVGVPFALWQVKAIRRHVPLAVLQILAGMILGPSILGRLFPDLQAALFPPETLGPISGLALIAVCLFSAISGAHLRLGGGSAQSDSDDPPSVSLKDWPTALASFAIPLGIGIGFGFALVAWQPDLVGDRATSTQFATAMGIAMAVTALPVLAAILREMGLLHTPLGQRALGLAFFNDAALWASTAVLLIWVKVTLGSSIQDKLLPLLLIPVFLGLMVFVVRPALQAFDRIISPKRDPAAVNGIWLTISCVLIFGASAFADYTGLGFVVGAFLAGVILPERVKHTLASQMEAPTALILMPFFYMLTGLKVNTDLTNLSLIGVALAAMVLSPLGKMAGTVLAARLLKQPIRPAVALGACLQTKGLMEVLLLTLLFDAGIVSPVIFSAMLMMTLVCTVMTQPLLRALGYGDGRAPPKIT